MGNVTFHRRLGAILYDGLLVLSLMFFGTYIFVVALGKEIEAGSFWYQLTLLLFAYFFFVGFWFIYGRTLGMQSWDLRLETANRKKPTLWQCNLRFFAAILSWIPLGLGFFWQLFDNNNLTWHDRISGTQLKFYTNL